MIENIMDGYVHVKDKNEINMVTKEYVDDYIEDIRYRVLQGRLPCEDMRIVERYKEYKKNNREYKEVDFKKLMSKLTQ